MITRAEFSRRFGVSRAAVTQAVQAGKIQLVETSTGLMVDPVQARRDWDMTTHPSAKRRRRGAREPEPGEPVQTSALPEEPPPPPAPPSPPKPPPPRAPDPEIFDYDSAVAEHETHKARLAKLKADELEGKLLDVEDVKREIMDLYRTVRSALETIPERLAAVLAGESDEAKVYQSLRQEIRDSLEKLSEDLASEPN